MHPGAIRFSLIRTSHIATDTARYVLCTPRNGRRKLRTFVQSPSQVFTCTSCFPSPSSSRAHTVAVVDGMMHPCTLRIASPFIGTDGRLHTGKASNVGRQNGAAGALHHPSPYLPARPAHRTHNRRTVVLSCSVPPPPVGPPSWWIGRVGASLLVSPACWNISSVSVC
jgi:hypothetical protein